MTGRPPNGQLERLHPETSVVFLALYWGGPEPISLADVLFTFDWLNHAKLSRSELEDHFNTLMSAGLVEVRTGNLFALPRRTYAEFDVFRRRRRKGRFEDAEAFVRQHTWQYPAPKSIRLSDSEFIAAEEIIRRRFAASRK